MKQELDDRLVKTFPLTYADRHKDKTVTCMCWGFNVSEGWLSIVEDLSQKLETLIQEWLTKNPDKEHPRVAQVKEKFGLLRVYLDYYDSKRDGDPTVAAMWSAINEAAAVSAKTCEWCGSPGVFRSEKMPWKKTFCDDHYALWLSGKRPWVDTNKEFPKEIDDLKSILKSIPKEKPAS